MFKIVLPLDQDLLGEEYISFIEERVEKLLIDESTVLKMNNNIDY